MKYKQFLKMLVTNFDGKKGYGDRNYIV